jgi:hypothetical protein
MKRGWKILAAMVLALGIAWLLLLMISHKNARDKVAAYKQELRAKGEKLTFAELAPAPSTKTPNGAKAFMDASNLLSSSSVDRPPMMALIAPGVARLGHTNIGPELMFNYASNVQRMATLRVILTNAAVLDFNLDYSKGVDLQLSHLSKLKDLEVVLSATAMQALYQKDYSEAWLDLSAAVDVVRLFDNEPLAISQLVRYAMSGTAMATTWEALQENEWTDAQLSELQSKWEGIDLLNLFESFIAMERADSVETLAKERKSWESIYGHEPFWGPAGGNLREKFGYLYDRYLRYWRWKSSWSYEQEHYYLQITTAAVEASRAIKASGAFVPALNEFHRHATNIDTMYPDRSNHFLLDLGYERIFDLYLAKLAEAEAPRRLLVTAIALKRYHLQHGAYPTSLDELAPNYLKQIPIDFMDGKPLRYRLRPDGDFLLYSVGEDGVDNGGDPSPAKHKSLFNWPSARDAVWPRAATPAEIAEYESHSGTETNVPGK